MTVATDKREFPAVGVDMDANADNAGKLDSVDRQRAAPHTVRHKEVYESSAVLQLHIEYIWQKPTPEHLGMSGHTMNRSWCSN